MKLAFCIFKYFPFGGLERNFLRITEACLAQGHETHVYTMDWQGRQPDGLKVTEVRFSGFSNHGRAATFVSNLEKILKSERYDLIVGFNRMPGLDLYYNADVCYVLDIARRRSFLSRLTPRYKVYLAFEKTVFGPDSGTHIMYLSEVEKQNYIAAYGTDESRFHYLPPGIDKERIRSVATDRDAGLRIRRELKLTHDDRMLLMVGSDFVRKGVSRSIKALAALPDNLRNRTRLFIIGRGGRGGAESFEKLSQRLGIGEQVHFTGGRDDVERFFSAADLLLHPAVSENTGNAIVEALVAGLPVLATDVCGYGFHVKDARAGDLVNGDPFRQEEMNQLLSAMLSSPKIETWRKNAIRYSDNTDLYSRPRAALEIIERVAEIKAAGGCCQSN